MPHIILEYSNNLSAWVRPAPLLGKLHEAVGDTEGFETDRIKSRALRLDTYRVASGEGHGFLHATVVFSPGRSEDTRRELGQRLLAILADEAGSADVQVSRSVEIRQFEPGLYFTDRDR